MRVLVTGGAGYIGSHTTVELIGAGHEVVVVDDFSNSNRESVKRIEKITNSVVPLYELDVKNEQELDKVFATHQFDAIIHFAGFKAVGESVAQPLMYYTNNIDSGLTVLRLMEKYGVKKFILSSTATVYGEPQELPLKETSQAGVTISNPYGWSKWMLEQILQDFGKAHPSFEITILRYFNPVGAHKSGLIGEDPKDVPNNLLPYVAQVAIGRRERVNVWGDDYDTVDGTGVRDYIHVVDLAKGHLAALQHVSPGVAVYNLGTGHGTSVLELIAAFSRAAGKEIPYQIAARRPGDLATVYASAEKAKTELGWVAEKTIDDACKDAWRWQSQNPNGFN